MRRKINIDHLPSNSRSKRPIERVDIEGKVRIGKKKTGMAYHIKNIGNSLFADMIWPAIQNLVVDFFGEGIRMLVFKDLDIPRRSRTSLRRSYNDKYNNRERLYRASDRMSRSTGPTRIHRSMPTDDVVEDIFFDNRESAHAVLDRLDEYIAEFGHATLGDLRAAVGFSATITHQRYGWTSLRGTKVLWTSDGYLIDFPPVEYL